VIDEKLIRFIGDQARSLLNLELTWRLQSLKFKLYS